jgi:thiamine-phosphate pyrophosphorylase
MTMSPLLVLTDRSQCVRPLVEVIAVAVESGARTVVLREKDLSTGERAALAIELRAILDPLGGLLIWAGPGGPAVHLAAAHPFPTARPAWVGRSCHDAAEVARAAAEGCDYVTISPVFATASKPGYGPALGIGGLAALCRTAPPAYALGGVSPRDVPACLGAGAVGVAVMGGIMRDPRSVESYVAALSEVSA